MVNITILGADHERSEEQVGGGEPRGRGSAARGERSIPDEVLQRSAACSVEARPGG